MSAALRKILPPIAAVSLLLAAGGARRTTGGTGEHQSHAGIRLVCTQLPPGPGLEKQGEARGGMLRADYGPGARIVLLEPGEAPRVLTPDFESACDPEISFDGTRLLFAGRRSAGEAWNIYEMPVEGGTARRITRDAGNCRQPIYQSALFTLDSPDPWYQISFISDTAGQMNEALPVPAAGLYSCRLDGSEMRRLSFNLSSCMDPCLLPDGRALFATWQRSSLRRGLAGRVALVAVNIDGTDYSIFSDERGRRVQHMPCVTAGGLVVFVEGNRVGWDGAGSLASVALRRNLHSYRPVTRPADGLFHSPSPLPDGRIVVSRRTAGASATFGLYVMDPGTAKMELVYDDPGRHEIQGRSLSPRPRPDGRSTVVEEKYQTGRLYCLDAYNSDIRPWIRRGTPLRLRVLEGLPRPASATDAYLGGREIAGAAVPGSTTGGIPPLAPRRFLGEVAVAPDGSFNVEVPANLPIQLQLLDASGMALETCDWIWVKNRESRGCIGCHEDQELAPENRFVQALENPSVLLTLMPSQRRTTDFRNDVLPIVEKKCATAACHGARAPILDARPQRRESRDLFSRAYEALLAREPAERPDLVPSHRYVTPGAARTSPLVWRLFGRNTSRPWDREPRRPAPVLAKAHAALLTEDEKRTLVEWIDLGAMWEAGRERTGSGTTARSGDKP